MKQSSSHLANPSLKYRIWPIGAAVANALILLIIILFGLHSPTQAQSSTPLSSTPITITPSSLMWVDKVDVLLLEEFTTNEKADFFVWLQEKADLGPAARLRTKVEKGQYVFTSLVNTAERSQAGVRNLLDALGAQYRPFYIANKILVQGGDVALAQAIASRPDVAKITSNPSFQLDEPALSTNYSLVNPEIEANLHFVNADDVWNLGFTGQGVVLAANDTGIEWDHPALIDHYRGWDGAIADHNYNWWDATGSSPTTPADNNGHGTAVSGVLVGEEQGYSRIGMAPGAQTIHCKNGMVGGLVTAAWAMECFEWDLAPWDLSGFNPRPDLAPDAINNSWIFASGSTDFEDEIAALQAAGILVEAAGGNSGPACSSVTTPGDYGPVLTVGAISHHAGPFPGVLADFSGRGPSSLAPGAIIPDVMAPGIDINTALPGRSYSGPTLNGTSFAGPHVIGLVGLMWSANPNLRGLITDTVGIILNTAHPLSGQQGSSCGGDYTSGPNQDWGYGTIDALAAVQMALSYGGQGRLAGTISDTVTGDPISGAWIEASISPTLTWSTMTDISGTYHLAALSGSHTVHISAFGYLPVITSPITVSTGMTTHLSVDLQRAAVYTLEGHIIDHTASWPLYAQIAVEGDALATYWNKPESGQYRLLLPAGITHTITVAAFAEGYFPLIQQIGPLTQSRGQNFTLEVDPVACQAPGYQPLEAYFEDFELTNGGYAHGGSQDEWAWGSPTAWPSSCVSGDSCWGTDLTGNYENNADQSLTSPLIDLTTVPSGTQLSASWWQAWEIEGALDDQALAEVRINAGPWQEIWRHTAGQGAQVNWTRINYDLSAAAGGNAQFRWRLTSNGTDTRAGLYVDDVAISRGCTPQTGGLVVGHVFQNQSGLPIVGATVVNQTGAAALSLRSPDDPSQSDGFFTLFSPTGAGIFTTTAPGGYAPEVISVTVVQSDTLTQNFPLRSGNILIHPDLLDYTVAISTMEQVLLTVVNQGGITATVVLEEINHPISSTARHLSPAELLTFQDPNLNDPRVQNSQPWLPAAPLPSGRSIANYAHAQCPDNPDQLYLISGSDGFFSYSSEVWQYDTILDQWTPLNPIPTPWDGVEGAAATCLGDKIYVLGGSGTATSTSDQFRIYDIPSDSWSNGPAAPRKVWGAALGAWDDRLYYIGGSPSPPLQPTTSAQVDIFDITAGSWIAGGGTSMPFAAAAAGWTQIGPSLYIVGGWSDQFSTNLASTQRYDLSQDIWEIGPEFESRRAWFALAATETHLYAIGGDSDGGGHFDALTTVEALNHTAWPGGVWIQAGDPLTTGAAANTLSACTPQPSGGAIWSIGGIRNGWGILGTNQFRPTEPCYHPGSDIPWLSSDPLTVSIPSGVTTTIHLTLNAGAPITQIGSYQARLRITTDTPAGDIMRPISMQVVTDVFRLTLTPNFQTLTAMPSEMVTYTLQLTNTGTTSDTFDLHINSVWTTTAPTSLGPIPPDGGKSITVTVLIPIDALDNANDTAIITATSQSDDTQSASASVKTTAIWLRHHLPLIRRE